MTRPTVTPSDDKSALTPKLRFPEFQDEPGWEERTVGYISGTVTAGGTPDTSEPAYWDGGIRWMASGELNLKRVYEVEGRITDAGLKNSSTKVIPPRCVLIGLAGQGKTRGTIAMNMVELCTNQSIAAIFPNEAVFNSDYLYHNLDSRYAELRRLSAGGEGRGGLNLQIIKSLPVPLPKPAEQQKIAECLSTLDELIGAESQKLAALKAHKKGLMQQLFPREGETLPRLRFPEFHAAPEWKEQPLSEVCEVLNNRRKPITSSERTAGPYPYYGASGIVDYVDNFIFEEPLLLVGEDGAKWGAFEKTAFVASGKYWVNNHAHVLRGMKVSNVFLENYLTKIDLSPFVTGAAPPKLTLGKLKIIPIPVPPTTAEQHRIAACLSSLDDLIATQSDRLAALQAHKQGLLQQLFPSLVGAAT